MIANTPLTGVPLSIWRHWPIFPISARELGQPAYPSVQHRSSSSWPTAASPLPRRYPRSGKGPTHLHVHGHSMRNLSSSFTLDPPHAVVGRIARQLRQSWMSVPTTRPPRSDPPIRHSVGSRNRPASGMQPMSLPQRGDPGAAAPLSGQEDPTSACAVPHRRTC